MTAMFAAPARADVAGILLAGGAGSRYGAGRTKAWVPTSSGAPLFQVALASLIRVAQTIVYAAPEGLELPDALPSLAEFGDRMPEPHRVLRVNDLAAGAGPLAGLVPALEMVAAAGATRAFILAVDMPRFSAGEFALLAMPLGRAPDAVAVVPRTPRGLEPLFACVRPAPVAIAFRAAWDSGERAVHAAFATLGPTGLVELDTSDPVAWPGGPARLRSINVPADLRAVLEEDAPPT